MSLGRLFVPIAALAAFIGEPEQGTRLLRHPTVSRDQIAFEYAGDLWVVARAGGSARRLTATPTVETDPQFSPDGSKIAFTATVGGNTDVYVIPTAGGDPTRLTFHPGLDRVRGWSPDGKRVIFASNRASPPHGSYFKLWSVPVEGGFPEALPMPRALCGHVLRRRPVVSRTRRSGRSSSYNGTRSASGGTTAADACIRSAS